jgi:hypothetical protein
MDLTLIATILGGVSLLVVLIGSAVNQSAGSSLNKKFAAMGNMQGMTLSQIVARVGSPNSITQFPDGEKLCQWSGSGFAVGLMFDSNDVCIRLAHQDNF